MEEMTNVEPEEIVESPKKANRQGPTFIAKRIRNLAASLESAQRIAREMGGAVKMRVDNVPVEGGLMEQRLVIEDIQFSL